METILQMMKWNDAKNRTKTKVAKMRKQLLKMVVRKTF